MDVKKIILLSECQLSGTEDHVHLRDFHCRCSFLHSATGGHYYYYYYYYGTQNYTHLLGDFNSSNDVVMAVVVMVV